MPRTQATRARAAPASRSARTAAFLLLTIALFVVALRIASSVRVGRYSLLQCFTRNYLTPGGQFHSLRRFRELDAYGHADVVFFGSSHAYRGFDPRVFEAAGYRAYNLGSTNQTPLNTYFLVERYLRKLSPTLVVFEVYYQTLSTDGLESCRDLTVNTPPSWPMLQMAVATWNVGAISFAIAKRLGFAGDESAARQEDVPGETYVAGGYAETATHRRELLPGEPITFDLRSEQLAYLGLATSSARASGARVVWVTHPLPSDHRSRIADRAALRARIREAARASDVEYWDFDEQMELDPLEDFADFHHLSQSGVDKFDRALLGRLRATGLLPEGAPAP